MAKQKQQQAKVSYISVPSQIIHSFPSSSLQSILLSPKKPRRGGFLSSLLRLRSPSFKHAILLLLILFASLAFLVPFSPSVPCPIVVSHYSRSGSPDSHAAHALSLPSTSIPAAAAVVRNDTGTGESESDFWKQPDGMGYHPSLEFSGEYRDETPLITRDRRKYLLVVVSGGLNQQRSQIIDAVVIARILGAALVAPVLQVNAVWGDESEFSDIFDLDHFKRVLEDDVRVVSSLPSTHLRTRPVEESRTPLHVSARWIRSKYLKKLNREGVLLLRGLDSRLSKDLPPDLQKLRCKVAFHALRFAAPIMELGTKLATRMRSKGGPYLALHLRLEKDVWVRTGCLPGLSHEYDQMIQEERKLRPELLTSRSHMSYHDRKLAGLCPLTAVEVTRLLKALGCPRNARIYWAGGEPFGGPEALLPLTRDFPQLYNKENISLPGELEPFAKRASVLAALDYIVAENSDVFMPSHGGNMGRTIQGHRAYTGHRKHITPNKRQMIRYFLDKSLPEPKFNRIIQELHHGSMGQPEIRKIGKDVTAFPVAECMCNTTDTEPVQLFQLGRHGTAAG